MEGNRRLRAKQHWRHSGEHGGDLHSGERIVKIRRIGNSLTMTIPLEAVELLGWTVGEELAVKVMQAGGEQPRFSARRLG